MNATAALRSRGTPASPDEALRVVRCVAWTVELPSRRTLYVSANAPDVLGYPLPAFDQPGFWLRMIHPEDREAWGRVSEDAVRACEGRESEYRIVRPDGSVRWMHDSLGIVVDADGRPVEMHGMTRDVTASREREAPLRYGAGRTGLAIQLLDSLGEGVSVATTDGMIVYVNAALERMLGYAPGELAGRNIRELSRRPAEAYDRRVAEITAEVDARGFWTGAMASRRKDGSAVATHGTITRVAIDGMNHWVAVRQDMTERHRVQRDVLDASQREKEELAHELHEGLGQQLTGIGLLAGTLRDAAVRSHSALAPSLQRLSEILVEAVGTCRRLAQGVAGFSMRNGGLVTGLRELALACECRYGTACTVQADAALAAGFATERARQLYWIADDGLALAGRHGAPGREVALRLERCEGVARLAVEIAGPTPERLAEAGGTTLRTLGYRAALLGAVVATRASPAGVVIECLCPLDEGIGVSP